MIQKVSVPATVKIIFDHTNRKTILKEVLWEGRAYPILKIGLHHTFREGRTLFHIFSVSSQNLFFRLSFNTDNLIWTVEEIADGLPD